MADKLEKILMFEWAELARRTQGDPPMACEAVKKMHEELDKYNGLADPYAKMMVKAEETRLSELSRKNQPVSLSEEFLSGMIGSYVSKWYMPTLDECNVSELLDIAEKRGYKAADNVVAGLGPYAGMKYKDIRSTIEDYEGKKKAIEGLKTHFKDEYNSLKTKFDGDENAKKGYENAKKVAITIKTIDDYKFEKMYADMCKDATDKKLDSMYSEKKEAEGEE